MRRSRNEDFLRSAEVEDDLDLISKNSGPFFVQKQKTKNEIVIDGLKNKLKSVQWQKLANEASLQASLIRKKHPHLRRRESVQQAERIDLAEFKKHATADDNNRQSLIVDSECMAMLKDNKYLKEGKRKKVFGQNTENIKDTRVCIESNTREEKSSEAPLPSVLTSLYKVNELAQDWLLGSKSLAAMEADPKLRPLPKKENTVRSSKTVRFEMSPADASAREQHASSRAFPTERRGAGESSIDISSFHESFFRAKSFDHLKIANNIPSQERLKKLEKNKQNRRRSW